MFLKNKGKKGKCISILKSILKNVLRNVLKSLKDGKKVVRKKVKVVVVDEFIVLLFLERV